MPNTMQTDTKIHGYIKSTLTEVKRQELQKLMGLSDYQWTWHMNYPTRWKRDKVVIMAQYLQVDWEWLAQEYELAKEKLSAA